MPRTKNKPATNSVRIIGGEFRGRRLSFPDVPGLRPTTDRVRETVFNWLQNLVPGAYCLDLFAGSGAMGFEALSRGARHVDFVDTDRGVCRQISENLATLNVRQGLVHCQAAEDFVAHANADYDLIFLDPPFQRDLLQSIIHNLNDKACLKNHARIYLEAEHDLKQLLLPPNWQLVKEKKAGNVHYGLLSVIVEA